MLYRSFFNTIIHKLSHIVPDKLYLQIVYRREMGKFLNLRDPKTFQEKLQWLKLYNRKIIYSTMVDKYKVKDYVSNIIGKKYIIPTLGVWDNANDIDFENLPDKFVLKTTHDSGGVIICNDKSQFDRQRVISILNNRLLNKVFFSNREWPYKNVIPRIIAEEYIEMPDGKEMIDYKIYCFNGVPKYIQVIQNRATDETIDFFDIRWNHQEFTGLTKKCKKSKEEIIEPKNLKEMITIGAKLSVNIPFVRIDLYNISGRIYFGEITFFPLSGLGSFTPAIWNEKMGDLIRLPEYKITI